MPVSVSGAIPLVYRWLRDAQDLGIDLLFETHRDSLLNDLYYTLELLDAVPELMLTADLSHFVLEREFQRVDDVAGFATKLVLELTIDFLFRQRCCHDYFLDLLN